MMLIKDRYIEINNEKLKKQIKDADYIMQSKSQNESIISIKLCIYFTHGVIFFSVYSEVSASQQDFFKILDEKIDKVNLSFHLQQ